MAQFRSSKRAKELKRAARHKAKEARKRERQKNAASREPGDDIDWSQAVGLPKPETDQDEAVEAGEAEADVPEGAEIDTAAIKNE